MTETKRRRRPRRSQEEILNLIRTSALQLFAERGFAGTTTQEIARQADVSETLLFRHFGDKSKLYDAVVSAPFMKIMETFQDDQQQTLRNGADAPNSRNQSRELYDFFEENREVFSALVLGATAFDDQEPVRLAGLESTFRLAAKEVVAAHERAGLQPPFDADIAVRLSFGMVAASVLLKPLLFSGSDATSEEIRDTIAAMSTRSLWPR